MSYKHWAVILKIEATKKTKTLGYDSKHRNNEENKRKPAMMMHDKTQHYARYNIPLHDV